MKLYRLAAFWVLVRVHVLCVWHSSLGLEGSWKLLLLLLLGVAAIHGECKSVQACECV